MISPAHPEPPRWSAILEVQDPDGRRSRHPFRHPRVRVGRRRDNDLSLADEAVSQQHCEFVSEQGFFVVRDLGSHNGTFVNERRIGEARLRDGDEVRIGGTRIQVALQGRVRKPPGVRWGRIALAVLAVAGLFAALIPLWQRERELRGRYQGAVRAHLQRDPCAAPQLAELAAADAKVGGRRFAIGHISQSDEETDLELLALFRRKLDLQANLIAALGRSQQEERESLERVARLGQRFSSAKDRKLAQWAESVLQDREKAGDDLLQGVRSLSQETQQLISLVEAVVVRRETARAPALAQFRFATDLRSLLQSCRAQSDRAASAAAGALGALAE